MRRTPPSRGKLLYHITHMGNIPSILQHGLLSREALLKAGIRNFIDIADASIISKRINLSRYVLFHFYAKNPFDCAVCNKYGSENMAIITIERRLHKDNRFFIIPTHPLDNNKPDIYPYAEGLKHIRWDILDMEAGRDYNDSEIRKACMAECVMEYKITTKAFSFIYVHNDEAKQQIENMPNGKKVSVTIAPNMFP